MTIKIITEEFYILENPIPLNRIAKYLERPLSKEELRCGRLLWQSHAEMKGTGKLRRRSKITEVVVSDE